MMLRDDIRSSETTVNDMSKGQTQKQQIRPSMISVTKWVESTDNLVKQNGDRKDSQITLADQELK